MKKAKLKIKNETKKNNLKLKTEKKDLKRDTQKDTQKDIQKNNDSGNLNPLEILIIVFFVIQILAIFMIPTLRQIIFNMINSLSSCI